MCGAGGARFAAVIVAADASGAAAQTPLDRNATVTSLRGRSGEHFTFVPPR